MNRLDQLKKTFPANLDVISRKRNTEMILLDYNSTDGLQEWISAGYLSCTSVYPRLLYARQPSAKRFHASKAKNMAHRIATGDILVNLDCDNFIRDSIAIIERFFTSSSVQVLHLWSGTWFDGTFGRIAIRQSAFDQLGGYDEAFFPVGYQDCDLLLRAQALGLGVARFPLVGTASLPNTKADTTRNCNIGIGYGAMNRANAQRSSANIASGKLRANPLGWGRGRVEVFCSRANPQ